MNEVNESTQIKPNEHIEKLAEEIKTNPKKKYEGRKRGPKPKVFVKIETAAPVAEIPIKLRAKDIVLPDPKWVAKFLSELVVLLR
jgi:hypothetical protein